MVMLRINTMALLCACIGLLCGLDAYAQPPRRISYQGMLANPDGSPVSDGSHALVIRLYTAGGLALFTEQQTVTTMHGLFNMDIGAITPLPPSLTFGEPYFLGISVDAGAELTPRTALSSVPYALNGTSVNGAAGPITLEGTGNTTITRNGNVITVNTFGGGFTLPFSTYYSGTTAAFKLFTTGAGSGIDIDQIGSGVAASFRITNAANPSAALEGITNGVDDGTAAEGPTGVLGRVAIKAAGPYSAGVRGVNESTNDNGIGVAGYQAGGGTGVYGESANGAGVYGYVGGNGIPPRHAEGVRGETALSSGTGVRAVYSGPGVGTALDIQGGAVRVSGSARPGFVHVCTAENRMSPNSSELNNPLVNDDPNAIIIVTHNIPTAADGDTTVYNSSPVGVQYVTGRRRWRIVNENGTPIAVDSRFNVWVIKQ